MNLKKFGSTEQRVYNMTKPIADSIGVRIWDICFEKEGAQWYLRVFIDKDEGISIDDCENLTRPLNKILDDEDPISQSYMLEVGSAGLERRLLKEEHFMSSVGSMVRVRLIRASEGEKELIAELKAHDKDSITVADGDEQSVINFSDIAFVKIYEDFD